MKIQIPDFRNLFTTGNIISAVSAAFICGMAWMNVQNSMASQGDRLTKVEINEGALRSNVQNIREDVATIKANQTNQNRSLEEVKDWLKTISARQNR